MNSSNFRNMKMYQLKQKLKDKELSCSGNKEVLIKRLEENVKDLRKYKHQLNYYVNSELQFHYEWKSKNKQNLATNIHIPEINIKIESFSKEHFEYIRECDSKKIRRLWKFDSDFDLKSRIHDYDFARGDFYSEGIVNGFCLHVVTINSFGNYEYKLIWEKSFTENSKGKNISNKETNTIGKGCKLPRRTPAGFQIKFPDIYAKSDKVICKSLLYDCINNLQALKYLLDKNYFNMDVILIKELIQKVTYEGDIEVLSFLCDKYGNYPLLKDLKIAACRDNLRNVKWILNEYGPYNFRDLMALCRSNKSMSFIRKETKVSDYIENLIIESNIKKEDPIANVLPKNPKRKDKISVICKWFNVKEAFHRDWIKNSNLFTKSSFEELGWPYACYIDNVPDEIIDTIYNKPEIAAYKSCKEWKLFV